MLAMLALSILALSILALGSSLLAAGLASRSSNRTDRPFPPAVGEASTAS